MARLLILSPYHSGSHRSWAEGFARSSSHEVRILSLPGKFWKWRMHGGAVSLARQLSSAKQPSALWMTTDMLDLSLLKSLAPQSAIPPIVLYMHENQLTYPLPLSSKEGPMRRQHGERDLHYSFINYSSMLVATEIWFNSRFHLESWFESLPQMLRHFPDENLLWTVARLRDKSRVLPVGIRIQPQPTLSLRTGRLPLILWNHRWEYDKNPGLFFQVLERLSVQQVPFEVAVCGENFRLQPAEFEAARSRLHDRIQHWGYADDELYQRLLQLADIVISTAHHDFFGISIAEAMASGCFPLVPNRLAYPELIPSSFKSSCLYETPADFAGKLKWHLEHLDTTRQLGAELAPHMKSYSWGQVARLYDQEIERILI